MTVLEMHIKFRLLLDRIEADYYKNIQPEEIDLFLNDAQERFIKTRFGGNNSKRTSFEETQKRVDDLRTIVIPDVVLTLSANQSGAKPGGFFFDLPADYMFSVQEEADITFVDCRGDNKVIRLGFVPTTLDDYNNVTKNPYQVPNPTIDEDTFGLRLMFDRLQALTFDNFTVGNYYLTYIKEPVKIDIINSVNCELPTQTHTEIVNIAVSVALEAIESPRFQQNRILLENQE